MIFVGTSIFFVISGFACPLLPGRLAGLAGAGCVWAAGMAGRVGPADLGFTGRGAVAAGLGVAGAGVADAGVPFRVLGETVGCLDAPGLAAGCFGAAVLVVAGLVVAGLVVVGLVTDGFAAGLGVDLGALLAAAFTGEGAVALAAALTGGLAVALGAGFVGAFAEVLLMVWLPLLTAALPAGRDEALAAPRAVWAGWEALLGTVPTLLDRSGVGRKQEGSARHNARAPNCLQELLQ